MTKILVVEDEDSFSDALSFLLGKEGFDVKVAADGVSALEIFAREGADLVLLDLMLPGLSGTEVCRQLRLKSAVPIIMLTAKDTEVDKVVGLELGADDYVTKPFGLEELLLRVGAILRRTKAIATENSVLRCGPLLLDEDQHKVFYGEEEVELSPTEFKLLLELMRNKGRVLTKTTLLREVWEIDFETETSVLDTYISYLRKKLNRDNLEFIRTVRGVGYQIVEPA